MAIYLDHAASTPLLPEVLAAYAEALRTVGNPSSIHGHGQRAKQALEESRERLALVLGCEAVEVVFTSGGTEAINAAIKGLYWAARNADPERTAILIPGGEHHATVDSVDWLVRAEGARRIDIRLDPDGRVLPDRMADALENEGRAVALASMLWTNNEVGTIQSAAEIGALAAGHGIPLHLDAVAALGHVQVNFAATGATAMSVSAHKIGGPVSIGALVLARRGSVVPLLHGGGQQRSVRSGTQDVAGAVAFALAAELAVRRLAEDGERMRVLRDRLVSGVLGSIPGATLRGAVLGPERVPGNANLTFAGCDGDSLLFALDMAGISVSTGSACTAGVPEVSHVLLDMGIPEDEARGALRFTLGRETTDADIDAVLSALPSAVASARAAGHSSRAPALY